MARVHLVEPGGRGGIYQHTVALATALAEAGAEVVLHTAADPELLPPPSAAAHHRCLWRFAGLRPRPLRRAAIAAGWLAAGMPGCLARVRGGDVVHVQGWFVPGLLAPLGLALGLRRCAFVYSPHNSFLRAGRRGERLLRWMVRRADLVVAFSEADRRRFTAWGARVVVAPFPFVVPSPDRELVTGWRRRWVGEEHRQIVLLAGQLRADKDVELLVRAMAHDGDRRLVLALVGEDLGALAPARRLAADLGVTVACDPGYQALDRFVAAIAAADVVVCPYRVASQSGVLALARALGRPSVATDVGGLAELATEAVPPGDVRALAAGVRRALEGPPPPPSAESPATVGHSYLSAYRQAVDGARWGPGSGVGWLRAEGRR